MGDIERSFPKLKNYRITSGITPQYNCIAWAAGENHRWWWPTNFPFSMYYWPAGVKREETIEAFIEAYRTTGYEICCNSEQEEGYEKIAIYAKKGVPKHAARMIDNNKWTSKLGENVDIEHNLQELEGEIYGCVHIFMKRKKQGQ